MTIRPLHNTQSGNILPIVMALVVLVAIGGVGAYVATGGFKEKTSNSSDTQQTAQKDFKPTSAATSDEVKAMFVAAKAGEYEVKCTYTDDSGNGSNIYISGATKKRIDTTISDKPGHMLLLGDSAYIWADGQSKGSKLPVTENSSKSSYSTDKFAENVQKYKITCQSVDRLDPSLFELPTDVTFTDFNSQIKSTQGSSN